MSFIRKRPRSGQKITNIQERRVFILLIALLVIALLWILFAPGSGVVTLISKRSELANLQQETDHIEQRIEEIQDEIDRLHNDPAYLEEIARKDHGLLKKNEKVYDFAPPNSKKNKK